MSLIRESRYLLKMGARSLEIVIVSVTRDGEIGNKDVCPGRCALYIAKKSVMSYREKKRVLSSSEELSTRQPR